tara:strand:+ start:450 stop:1070 length:621 start_codon:yes stop_codon:yes gene_type:complete
MPKTKSLLYGIGNQKETERYYDDWATNYDETLKNWNYKAPKKAVDILFNLKKNIIFNLDLACGTGLFGEELIKKNNKIIIDGCDISSKSLKITNKKNLYRNLFKQSFEKKIKLNHKYDSVSMIGSMTYCKKPNLLFPIIFNYLKKNGIFIFTHRVDLWIKQDFDSLIHSYNKLFKFNYKSRPLNYLPENIDFSNKVKIRIVGLKKI